jgi:hypothetical protein
MHPSVEGFRDGAGWLQAVVPRFNEDLQEAYERDGDMLYPFGSEVQDFRNPHYQPPLFWEQIPWLERKRVEQLQKEAADQANTTDASGPSPSKKAVRVLRRSQSCPNLERISDPEQLMTAEWPPNMSVQAFKDSLAKTIRDKFAPARSVVTKRKMEYSLGVMNPSAKAKYLERPARYAYAFKAAPLAEAFEQASIGKKKIPAHLQTTPKGHGKVIFYSEKAAETSKFSLMVTFSEYVHLYLGITCNTDFPIPHKNF